jgi:hypothetical protein
LPFLGAVVIAVGRDTLATNELLASWCPKQFSENRFFECSGMDGVIVEHGWGEHTQEATVAPVVI